MGVGVTQISCSGQNVRLAAKLTGWKIDIQPVSTDGIAKDVSEDMEKESE
jgi:transcription antitermination factor NusA-like protein